MSHVTIDCPHCGKSIDLSVGGGARTTKPSSRKLYVFGWPSHVGGADTRLAHTLKLWTKFMDVTVVPNEDERIDELYWNSYVLSLNADVRPFGELPGKLEGYAVAMGNPGFFTSGMAADVKGRGLYVVWSGEMMWHFPGELEALRQGVVDCVIYSSDFNRKALAPGHLNARPQVEHYVIENYLDASEFAYSDRTQDSGRPFTIGRLSRPDPLKYPENFPVFYELLGLKDPRYRVMAWDEDLAEKYRWHHFGPEWDLLGANEEPQLAFLYSLDAFVYPLGHRFQEAWGRSTVEAMLSGLPVVVPKGHYFPQLIENGVSGFLCATFEEYRDTCQALQANGELRRKIGRRAHEHAKRRNCDAAAHIARWKEVFHA